MHTHQEVHGEEQKHMIIYMLAYFVFSPDIMMNILYKSRNSSYVCMIIYV